jgi:regulator of sirC expression with transglutaminase-like and TPR domain
MGCRTLALIVTAALCMGGRGAAASPASDGYLAELREILAQPEHEIDLTRAKLAVDRIIDPKIDVQETVRLIESMASDIRSTLPPGASVRATAEALRKYLYEPNLKNAGVPFSYDLDDPFGRQIQNKLLPTYLRTKRGNCVSMPFLYIAIGQKLGLTVTASRAPQHLLVKIGNGAGGFINFEATSGGVKSDDSYRQEMMISKEALVSGIYLRTLTKKETVSAMLGTLMDFYRQQGNTGRALAAANLALEYHPKNVEALLQKRSIYLALLRHHFLNKYPTPAHIPYEDRALYAELDQNVSLILQIALDLGWREPDASMEAQYQRTMQKKSQDLRGSR